jgi:hypothetical protein
MKLFSDKSQKNEQQISSIQWLRDTQNRAAQQEAKRAKVAIEK